MNNELEKEIGLLKQRIEQQQLEIRQLKHDERLLRQKYRRLVQKYGELLYTFEWTIQSFGDKFSEKEQALNEWSEKYLVLDKRYRRLVHSKAGKAILKAQSVVRRIKK